MVVIQSSSALSLDANLLLLLFIAGKDTSLIKKAKYLSAYTEEDCDLLQELVSLNHFTALLEIPHIITEVSNLLGKKREDIKCSGREAVVEFLARCNERSDSSAKLASNPEFKWLCITDVAMEVAADASKLVLNADFPFVFIVQARALMWPTQITSTKLHGAQLKSSSQDPAGGARDAGSLFSASSRP